MDNGKNLNHYKPVFKDNLTFLADISKTIARIGSETPCFFLYVTWGEGEIMRKDSSLARKGFTLGSKPAFYIKEN
jgi:hypothetical protein